LGENLSDAPLCGICRRWQLLAAVNFQLRWAPFVLAARHLLDYSIGDIHDIEVRGSSEYALAAVGLYVRCTEGGNRFAIQYLRFVSDLSCQTGMYFENGGRPAARTAFLDVGLNRACSGFFANTLVTVNEAYLGPRYNGCVAFQEQAGNIFHRGLANSA
jgi:hypothetical protein